MWIEGEDGGDKHAYLILLINLKPSIERSTLCITLNASSVSPVAVPVPVRLLANRTKGTLGKSSTDDGWNGSYVVARREELLGGGRKPLFDLIISIL